MQAALPHLVENPPVASNLINVFHDVVDGLRLSIQHGILIIKIYCDEWSDESIDAGFRQQQYPDRQPTALDVVEQRPQLIGHHPSTAELTPYYRLIQYEKVMWRIGPLEEVTRLRRISSRAERVSSDSSSDQNPMIAAA